MSPEKNFLHLGYVGRPHGIKGEIKLDWHGDLPPQPGQNLYAHDDNGKLLKFKINSARWHQQNPLVFLQGINSRTEAEAIKGRAIYLKKSELPPLDEDEAWLNDIIHCQAYLPDGQLLGEIDHVEFPAGQEIWSIKRSDGLELLFPARQEFIVELDLVNGRVILDPPAGLVDLYLPNSPTDNSSKNA